MKWYLLFACFICLLLSHTATAQSSQATHKWDPCVYHRPSCIKSEGYPCDSLKNIRGLKNVTCSNYAVVTRKDAELSILDFVKESDSHFVGFINKMMEQHGITLLNTQKTGLLIRDIDFSNDLAMTGHSYKLEASHYLFQ